MVSYSNNEAYLSIVFSDGRSIDLGSGGWGGADFSKTVSRLDLGGYSDEQKKAVRINGSRACQISNATNTYETGKVTATNAKVYN